MWKVCIHTCMHTHTQGQTHTHIYVYLHQQPKMKKNNCTSISVIAGIVSSEHVPKHAIAVPIW